MNLTMVLEMAVAGHPDRVAVGDRAQGLTFGRLHRLAAGGAHRVGEEGASAVVYVGTNGPAFAVAVFASAWAGVPIVPINYRLGQERIASLVRRHGDAMVIADDPGAFGSSVPGRRCLTPSGWLAAAEASASAATTAPSSDDSAVAVVLYTSGTTSEPKAAVLRHRHLMAYVLGTVEFGGAEDEEAVLVAVPPYHVAGVANLVTNLYAGRRIVYLDAFTPEAWLATARRQQVTNAMVVPTMLVRIVEHLGSVPADVPTLRTLSYGGSKVAPSVVARALRLFPTVDFVNAYGLTETSSTIALLGPEDHRDAMASDDPQVRARLGSAGRPVPGIDVQIRRPDGSPAASGESGELWVRGDQISGEYLGQGVVVDDDGWFPTRDIAHVDRDGYLFIEGRADDTIIRGGENIAPAEIEEVLLAHPEVGDAAVVGVADEEWGQRIVAVIVPVVGAHVRPDDVREFVRARLRGSKTPDEVLVWERLPYTDTGKLLRRRVLDAVDGRQPQEV